MEMRWCHVPFPGDRLTGVMLRTVLSPKPLAGSRKTTSAWLNPAAYSSLQLEHMSLQIDYAVT